MTQKTKAKLYWAILLILFSFMVSLFLILSETNKDSPEEERKQMEQDSIDFNRHMDSLAEIEYQKRYGTQTKN